MVMRNCLKQGFERIEEALGVLESAVKARLADQSQISEADEEIQRINADRSRLARELDKSKARTEQLEMTNKEVSLRLIRAMKVIRSII